MLTKDYLLEAAVMNSIEGTSHDTKPPPKGKRKSFLEKEKFPLWKDKFIFKIQVDFLPLELFFSWIKYPYSILVPTVFVSRTR